MVKTELRIGNFLNCGIDEDDNGNEIPMPGRVLQLFETVFHWTPDLDQQSIQDGYNSTDYEYVEGIPLTPELLERCGFVKNIEYGFWHRSELRIWQEKVAFVFEFRTLKEIKHLHQLQNLYFALTGEELEIKP